MPEAPPVTAKTLSWKKEDIGNWSWVMEEGREDAARQMRFMWRGGRSPPELRDEIQNRINGHNEQHEY
jgi:hypothetical protein